MARKTPKKRETTTTIVLRLLRAGEAFFRTPETENNERRRLVAENTVLSNNNNALSNKLSQYAQALEHELSKKQHDTDILDQLRKDYAWEKQQRIVLEEQLKAKESKLDDN